MTFFKKSYEGLWKSIIRPKREIYDLGDLGPAEFTIENRRYQRNDIILYNQRNMKLVCSLFEPIPEQRIEKRLPCVIFLHGNCSSRLEGINTLHTLLPLNITVFCFDMSGSGLSDGEYVTLGWYERDDVACVIDYLRSTEKVSYIGLWGRSMGAVTALMHGHRDPSIAAMVIDSPFSSMSVLLKEIAKDYTRVPGFLVSLAKGCVKKTIRKKANFNLFELEPIKHVDKCFIPALFVAANQDELIKPHHSERLHDKYAGEKSLIIVDGDHNSDRPQYALDSIGIFFYNTLQCENSWMISHEEERKMSDNLLIPMQEDFQSTSVSELRLLESQSFSLYYPKLTEEEQKKFDEENQRLMQNLGYLNTNSV
ncbi:unnamed protein product [Blepharisma stoltei]|uniref:Serine aminopeptidase S33 domain-containing protein n=1 Tax=Blepharisma stoltei TaxID=1481888 RepID=A0AAU9JXA9_9CILI|nr:unnamed protein product [Blepharisma stoltei]